MVILNQMRDSVYIVDGLERIHTTKDFDIRCYTCTGCHHVLGKYNDEEQTKKVFNDLVSAITQGWQTFKMPPRFKQNLADDKWNKIEYSQKVGAYR